MKKNNTLNLLKFVSIILIIFIHAKLPNTLGQYISSIARFAVPVFFMISGYYSYKSNSIKQHISKIFKLLIYSCILFFIYKNIHYIYIGKISYFYNNLLTFSSLKKLLLYNQVVFSPHLWFLGALLYTYIIYYLFDKKGKTNILYYAIPFLLILNVFSGEYIGYYNLDIERYTIRNFLYTGIPFFMLGNLIHKTNINNKFNNKQLIFLIVLSLITTIIEYEIFNICEIYLSTIILSSSLFIFAINNNNLVSDNNKLAIIGDKYTLGIYISHYLYIEILKTIIYPAKYTTYINNHFYIPFIIIIISFVFTIIYYKLKDKIIKQK